MDFNKIKAIGLEYAEKGKNAAMDLAEKGKTQALLVNEQGKLLKAQRQLGALVYSLAKGKEENQPLVDKYIEMIDTIEQEIARLRQEQEKARRDTQIMREKTEKERLRLHDEVRAKAGELMRAWKEGRATHKQALKEMSRLRADLAAPVVQEETSVLPQIEHFAPGQQVFHTVFNKRGVVTDVDERRKRVRVDLNGVSLWAAMKDVRQSGQSAQAAAPRAPQRVSPVKAAIANDDAPALRLDLRGMRADQAQAEVERFLDKALLSGFSEVEIVHGRGTGALRRQIHDFLRSFPAVARFATAPEDRGGDGMTIVNLR